MKKLPPINIDELDNMLLAAKHVRNAINTTTSGCLAFMVIDGAERTLPIPSMLAIGAPDDTKRDGRRIDLIEIGEPDDNKNEFSKDAGQNDNKMIRFSKQREKFKKQRGKYLEPYEPIFECNYFKTSSSKIKKMIMLDLIYKLQYKQFTQTQALKQEHKIKMNALQNEHNIRIKAIRKEHRQELDDLQREEIITRSTMIKELHDIIKD